MAEQDKQLPKPPTTQGVSREELGKSLRALKLSQLKLPTAVSNIGRRSATTEFRFSKLQLYGKGSLAYSSMQKGIKYFMQSEFGYVPYVSLDKKGDRVVVLADPICKHDRRKTLLEEFLKEHTDPIFLHICHDTAQVLSELGFFVNQFGVETIIDLQQFDLVGNKKQQLRQARNKGEKDGLTVVEVQAVDDKRLKELKKVSNDWLKSSVVNTGELRFIVRPIVYVDEWDVRKFVALKDDQIVGFVFFDPMYEEGQVIGYLANQLRSNLDRSYSVADFIILKAIEQFKAEGKRELSLGLSPLYKVGDAEDFRHSRLLAEHFKYCFDNANFLYNFRNLAGHKRKYRPELLGAREEKVYCAMKTTFSLLKMFSVYQVLGINPLTQTISHIKKKLLEILKSVIHSVAVVVPKY